MKSRNKVLLSSSLIIGGVVGLLMISCSSMPKHAKPVKHFDVNRYLGNWYEIARFDFRFEKDMNNTMAQYSLNEKGNVKVLNSGYNYKKDEWSSAEGVAKFREDGKYGRFKS
ncbi:MAG TPA: lipocalin family protein [Flavobacteriaceae bacterium]|nr:lipocalin family protein [Flavobacteriaceae bacterium]